ncbi:hypothetical protein GCM10010271_00410 [Streptomyces kurssanovii]|nr:hypothetical protein GCM10010271_00410 [Streptomyces kurssanovii]
MTDLEMLASLPASGDPGMVHNDWEAAEKSLRVTFPSSFMRFLDVFGGAKFDDFLRVYRVGADNENVDLVAKTLKARHTMEVTRPHIHDLLSSRGLQVVDLISWGGTDNADMCFLLPHADPKKWAVLTVIGRGQEYDLFEGCPESYLLQVMRRDFVSDVFPEDFPDDFPGYERHPDI